MKALGIARRIDLVLFVVAALAVVACQTTPYTRRRQLMLVSSNQEKALGIQAYQEVLKNPKTKLSTDQQKIALMRQVGHRLAKAADRPDFQWEFNLIEDDKTINAWCLPGGKVAAYTGIWPVMEDEQGIAVVMGHEIAHALARHGAERMSQAMPANMVGQIGSLLLSGNSRIAQEAFQQAYGLGAGLVILKYSRGQESEADHIGLVLMAKAGYDPQAAVPFWQRMAKAAGDKGKEDAAWTQYFRTHPLDTVRIKDIQGWMAEAQKCRDAPNAPECSLK